MITSEQYVAGIKNNLDKIIFFVFFVLFLATFLVAITSAVMSYRQYVLNVSAKVVQSDIIDVVEKRKRRNRSYYYVVFNYDNPEYGWRESKMLIDIHSYNKLKKNPDSAEIEAVKAPIPKIFSEVAKATRYFSLQDHEWTTRIKGKNHFLSLLITSIVTFFFSSILGLCFVAMIQKKK